MASGSDSSKRAGDSVLVSFRTICVRWLTRGLDLALAKLLAELSGNSGPSVTSDPATQEKLRGIAEQLGALLSDTPTHDPNVAGGQVSLSPHSMEWTVDDETRLLGSK